MRHSDTVAICKTGTDGTDGTDVFLCADFQIYLSRLDIYKGKRWDTYKGRDPSHPSHLTGWRDEGINAPPAFFGRAPASGSNTRTDRQYCELDYGSTPRKPQRVNRFTFASIWRQQPTNDLHRQASIFHDSCSGYIAHDGVAAIVFSTVLKGCEMRSKIRRKDKRPILRGYQITPNMIAVFCPYCDDFHFHGWDNSCKPTTIEHRGAHCHNNSSPFRETGYWISEFSRSALARAEWPLGDKWPNEDVPWTGMPWSRGMPRGPVHAMREPEGITR